VICGREGGADRRGQTIDEVSRGGPVTAYADANLCIALLAGPPHSAHDVAVEMFRRVAEGRLVLILTPVIVAEIVYAARTRFRWGNREIARRLAAFLGADGLIVREGPNVMTALGFVGERHHF
jgi:predicted nucleic acid-binding protein